MPNFCISQEIYAAAYIHIDLQSAKITIITKKILNAELISHITKKHY